MADKPAEKVWTTIAILAKAPQPGEVQTRLCPPLSYGAAAELYRCFLLDKIAQVNTLQRAAPIISYSPSDSKAVFEDLTPAHFMLIPQHGDNLGGHPTRATFSGSFDGE